MKTPYQKQLVAWRKRRRNIYKDRVIEKLSLNECARKYKISTTSIDRIVKRHEQELKKHAPKR